MPPLCGAGGTPAPHKVSRINTGYRARYHYLTILKARLANGQRCEVMIPGTVFLLP